MLAGLENPAVWTLDKMLYKLINIWNKDKRGLSACGAFAYPLFKVQNNGLSPTCLPGWIMRVKMLPCLPLDKILIRHTSRRKPHLIEK